MLAPFPPESAAGVESAPAASGPTDGLRAPRKTEENTVAGHSKWANIKHKKAIADAKKGKAMTRCIREITVAARSGGGDPDGNPRLRLAISKAREVNTPKDTIENAIKRGSGALTGESLDEIRYEGYGIGGAAVMVDCVTNNKVRTVADVRHAFAKNGGNMGTDGSVAFQFKHCGQFVFAPGTSEEKVMEIGLDAGAEDVATNEDGSVELICPPPEFTAVKTALEAAGLKAEFAEVTMKPLSETVLTGDDGAKMQRLLDALEALDDVQEVYTTALVED